MIIRSSASLLGCNRCEARWQQWVSTEDLRFVFIKNKGKHFTLGSLKALANISYQQCYFSSFRLGSSIPVPKLFEHFRPKSVMMDWAILSYTTNKFWAFPEIVQLWSCKSLCAVDHRIERRLLYSSRHNKDQLQKEPGAWNNNPSTPRPKWKQVLHLFMHWARRDMLWSNNDCNWGSRHWHRCHV